MSYLMLLVAAMLLAANGFFVAVEFALMGSRRPRIEQLADGGSRRARLALASMSDLQRQLAGAQLGITMASVALGFVAESALADIIGGAIGVFGEINPAVVHGISYPAALVLVAFLHLLLGEMVPKNLAIAGPENAAMWLAPPHRVFVMIFRPVIWALYATAVGIVKLIGLAPKDEISSVHSPQELRSLVRASMEGGLLHEFDCSLLEGALEFRERRVDSIMTPAAALISVSEDANPAFVEQLILETGHSRIPVVGESADDLRGFIHVKDLLGLSPDEWDHPLRADLVREVLSTPPAVGLGDLLLQMRRQRIHLAVVQDQEGSTLGIVTLEDVVEQLVGDIRDESDPQLVL